MLWQTAHYASWQWHFTMGAIGCVLAPSIYLLLAARFIQGIGAATSAVVVSAIIADHYKTEQATKLYGLMNAVFTTLMAMAPVMGGFINKALGWRGNYGIVAMICILSWLLLFTLLPETKKTKEKLRLDKIREDYKVLLSNSIFLRAAAIPSLLYGCYMAFVAIAPYIYLKILGLSIMTYTLHQAIVVAAFALTSSVAGKITDSLKPQKTLYLALGFSVIGSLFMLAAKSSFSLTFTMCLFSIGFTLIYPIVFARSMEIFPDIKGTASSVIMSMRYFICAGVTGVASCIYRGKIIDLASVIALVSLLILILLLSLSRHKLFVVRQA